MSLILSFSDLSLDPRLLAALEGLGFEAPTPIQAEALPPLLEGRDLIGGARTGSGKTAAFGLAMLERVKAGPRVVRGLILAPTRELALQVATALETFAAKLPGVRILTVYGGVSYLDQLRGLEHGVQIVVGTPGRVLDLMEKGHLDLSKVEMTVLDEADEMLRMGFIDDVQAILGATPETRQMALFSATMPEEIQKIASRWLRNPHEARVEERMLSVDHIAQAWVKVPERHKVDALVRVLKGSNWSTALVFARTRADCAEVSDALADRGFAVDALHGDLSQSSRELVLKRLRSGQLRLVVATDVAARGIDVEHITHVVNFNVPPEVESYVHRIGRTGRAGREGMAISLVSPKEFRNIQEIQRTLGVKWSEMHIPSDAEMAAARRRRVVEDWETRAPTAGVTAWFRELLEAGWTAERLALAALARAAEKNHLQLDEKLDTSAPSWARASERMAPLPRNISNQVEIFFPVGLNRRLRPGDIVGALANEAGVPSPMIGRVTIMERKSFVGLPEDVAAEVMDRFPSLELRGVRVPLALARPIEAKPEPRMRGKKGNLREEGDFHPASAEEIAEVRQPVERHDPRMRGKKGNLREDGEFHPGSHGEVVTEVPRLKEAIPVSGPKPWRRGKS